MAANQPAISIPLPPRPAPAPLGPTYVHGARTIEYVPGQRNGIPSRRYYFWMMAPAITVMAAISLYPFVWLIWMSLHNVEFSGSDTFVGTANFVRLFTRDAKF